MTSADVPPTIRPVEPADRDEWLRIRTAFWPDHAYTQSGEIDGFFAGALAEPTGVLVVEHSDRLIGLAELSVRPHAEGCSTQRVGYLEGWYVDPEHRSQGIGRDLLAAAEDWARGEGCTEFASDTTIDNELSRKAHLACGFTDAGLIRCFHKTL